MIVTVSVLEVAEMCLHVLSRADGIETGSSSTGFKTWVSLFTRAFPIGGNRNL